MSLESQYRTVLLWYPSTWREENADVVVGTLMDEADAAGRTAARPSELLNLAVNGLARRVSVGLPALSGIRDRLASLGLGAGLAISLIMFVGAEWSPWGVDKFDWVMIGPGFGPFASAAAIVNILWILAAVLSVVGLTKVSKALLLISAGVGLAIIPLIHVVPSAFARPPATALIFLAGLSIAVCLGRPSRSHALIAAIATAAVFSAITGALYYFNGWHFAGRFRNGWQVSESAWWPTVIFGIALIAIFVASRWVLPLCALAVAWCAYSAAAYWTIHHDTNVVLWALFGAVAVPFLVGIVSLAVGGLRTRVAAPPLA
jgi:hypothetical protein